MLTIGWTLNIPHLLTIPDMITKLFISWYVDQSLNTCYVFFRYLLCFLNTCYVGQFLRSAWVEQGAGGWSCCCNTPEKYHLILNWNSVNLFPCKVFVIDHGDKDCDNRKRDGMGITITIFGCLVFHHIVFSSYQDCIPAKYRWLNYNIASAVILIMGFFKVSSLYLVPTRTGSWVE